MIQLEVSMTVVLAFIYYGYSLWLFRQKFRIYIDVYQEMFVIQ